MVVALAGGATPELRCYGDSYLMKGLTSIPIVLFGIFANIMVIIVAWQHWKTYAACQKLITYLAGFDLLFAVMKLVVTIPLLWTCQWMFGDIGCKMFGSVLGASSSIAIGLILIISIERYIGIANPFSRGLSRSHIQLGCLATIVAAFILMVPYTLNVYVSPVTLECVDNWVDPSYSLVYHWILFIVAFLIPIIILLIVNFRIIKVVNHTLINGACSNGGEVEMASSQERQFRHRQQENKRILRILASLLVAFILLVLPNKVYWLLNYHGLLGNLSEKEMNVLINVLDVCYSVHVSINSVIYSIVDVRFRRHLKEMFC